MTVDELKDLITIAGYSCRVQRGQVALETCHFCGNDRYNLELAPEKGVYHCWACRSGGRLEGLLTQLTGQSHSIPVQLGKRNAQPSRPVAPQEFKSKPVGEVQSAVWYLQRRGVSAEVAATYGMVVCLEPGHLLEGRIAIPARDFWTADVLGWVGRSYTGAQPKYLSTMPRKTISGWWLRRPDIPAVIVEGLLDGIAVHQAGYSAAALLGVGASGIVDWAARLDPVTPVVIMLDGSAGEQAHHIYWQIQPVRPHVALARLAEDADPSKLGPAGVRAEVERTLSSGLGT